jgi:hypothetical protein
MTSVLLIASLIPIGTPQTIMQDVSLFIVFLSHMGQKYIEKKITGRKVQGIRGYHQVVITKDQAGDMWVVSQVAQVVLDVKRPHIWLPLESPQQTRGRFRSPCHYLSLLKQRLICARLPVLS